VVLIAGTPQGGRTTTLYTVTQMHDAYTSNVQTVETEPLVELEGIRQIKFDPSGQEEYAKVVRSNLRRDPDVLAVAEIPDQETAKEIAGGDVERTRVYAALTTDSAMNAVRMWVKAVGDPKLAAKGLSGVVAQRLIRHLCGNCRVPYQPPPELLKKLQLPSKIQQLYKKGGQVLVKNKPEVCPVCNGIGYEDQLGVFEVYPIGPEERACIAKQDWNGLKTEMRKRQLPGIQQVALIKAAEGQTSIEEVTRLSAKPAAKK
jgi:type II secretory ATPase GspE/PulE/Tfp pilus assembly ATPase PilB-like protein